MSLERSDESEDESEMTPEASPSPSSTAALRFKSAYIDRSDSDSFKLAARVINCTVVLRRVRIRVADI